MPFDGGIIDVSPTRRVLHLSYIDSDGKPRTDSYDIPQGATDAVLNTLASAAGALSNASLWNVAVTNHFAIANPSKANADDLTNDSVMDNMVILMKTLGNLSFDFFVPANNEVNTMVPGTENADPLAISALVAAIEAVWPGYDPISVRFSERSKKNRATKF